MFNRVPKKFQLDLSVHSRKNIKEEPAEEMPIAPDLAMEDKNTESGEISFRERLAKKIAEDDALGGNNQIVKEEIVEKEIKEEIVKKEVAPKIFKMKSMAEKLNLRGRGSVPAPAEISDKNENEEVVENLDPQILKLKPLASEPAEEKESLPEEAEKIEELKKETVVPAKPKKKRRRKKKVAPVIPAVQAPVVAGIPNVDPAVVNQIISAVILQMNSSVPQKNQVAPDVLVNQIPSQIPEPIVEAAPVVGPIKKKKRKKRKLQPKAEAVKEVSSEVKNQAVPIKIAPVEKALEETEEEINKKLDLREEGGEKSFRQSLEIKVGSKNIEKPASYSFTEKTLENGLRVIFSPLAGTKTITALVMFRTGSKYESRSQNGISHFLEHMFFKGTKKRPNAQNISCELDSLGCEYNAFTTKECTGYWIKSDNAKTELALDIISDMLLNSKFSQAEIEREKGVIIEEINMYHENPMMYIEDVFEKCLYGETPAGREILGSKENISVFKRQNFLDYFSSQYGSNSAVLVLSGAVNRQTEELVSKYFDQMIKRPFKEKLKTPDQQEAPQVKLHYQNGKQSNISLGVRTYDTYHKDKIILKVLSVILGGSMSSRMFTEVREKRGLAYYVRTQTEFFTDTGYLTTQAGVPANKAEEAIETILVEYQKIAEKPVDKEELQRARDLIRGRTVIAFEESDSMANWYARQAVLDEGVMTPDQFFEAVDNVTAEDIQRVAENIFKANKLNLAVIGPYKNTTQFEKILNFKKSSKVLGFFSFFA